MKQHPLNEVAIGALVVPLLKAMSKNPQAAAALGQLAVMGTAAAVNGVKKLRMTMWEKGWIPIYAHFLRKEYGEDFMKMVHDLAGSAHFKSAVNRRAYELDKIDYHEEIKRITPEEAAKRRKAIDTSFVAKTNDILEVEFPDHVKTLQQTVSNPEKSLMRFVDKEYGFRYNPQNPGVGDPEYPKRKSERASKSKGIKRYKEALRRAKIKNPKTGNTILVRTVLTGEYDDQLKQQAKLIAQQLRTKHGL